MRPAPTKAPLGKTTSVNRRSLLLTGLVAAPLAAGAAIALAAGKPPVAPLNRSIGGPFSLVDQNGQPVSERSLLGRPTAIFFGFTYCPEVCPNTLTRLSGWMRALGPAADRLNVVFVSVDPERDTPKQLRAYLEPFDPRIRGYTGSPVQVAQIARNYRVYYKRLAQPGGEYTVDHSSAIYLMDARGQFVEPITYSMPEAPALAAMKRLVGAG